MTKANKFASNVYWFCTIPIETQIFIVRNQNRYWLGTLETFSGLTLEIFCDSKSSSTVSKKTSVKDAKLLISLSWICYELHHTSCFAARIASVLGL